MVDIREAKLIDVNAIWDLGKCVQEFETADDIVTFWPKSILKNCIDKNDVQILVAEARGGRLSVLQSLILMLLYAKLN